MVIVLGISAGFHDAAAAIVADDEILAAAQEERFSRTKNDRRFPSSAIAACLRSSNLELDAVDSVAFYEQPHRVLARLVSRGIERYPRERHWFRAAISSAARDQLRTPVDLRSRISEMAGGPWEGEITFVAHHRSHAASAFHPSPFERAAVLIADGVGEWAATTIGFGHTKANGVKDVELLRELCLPSSLGIFYSAITHYLGFDVNEGEYKVMGLAAFGQPEYRDRLFEAVVIRGREGSFRLDEDVLPIEGHPGMYDAERMVDVLGVEPRRPGEPVREVHADLAASAQAVLEEQLMDIAATAHEITGATNLVMAGGVALNCVANSRLLAEGPFSAIWVQPAAGDAGAALGAALDVSYRSLVRPGPRRAGTDGMRNARLGPAFSERQIDEVLSDAPFAPQRARSKDELVDLVAGTLAAGAVVGWFQGRMEFGPRALGSRSILAHPGVRSMQERLNRAVKGREDFRPFAPVVLRECVDDWFEITGSGPAREPRDAIAIDSPYMLFVGSVREEHLSEGAHRTPWGDQVTTKCAVQEIAGCVHVDGTARLQTLSEGDDVLLHRLLSRFYELTGTPMLINTSFNGAGEPIVCSPRDALDCALRIGLDVLVVHDVIVWLRHADGHRPSGSTVSLVTGVGGEP